MNLEELLGIRANDPLQRRARLMVEADEALLDELVSLRKQKGLRQEEVAERMEISQSAVARIESGERDPRLSTLRRYAMAVGAVYEHNVLNDEPNIMLASGAHRALDVEWPRPERTLVVQDAAPSR